MGTRSGNRAMWERHFETLSVRSIRGEAWRGAQQVAVRCMYSLFHRLDWHDLSTWLRMGVNSQVVVFGLLTGLICYDLILLERPNQ